MWLFCSIVDYYLFTLLDVLWWYVCFLSGCIFAGFFIMLCGYYDKKGQAIAFLILGIGFSGLNQIGYAVNHLDIAPRYAGVLMGISNTFATVPGFLSPLVTGHIARNKVAIKWVLCLKIFFIHFFQ